MADNIDDYLSDIILRAGALKQEFEHLKERKETYHEEWMLSEAALKEAWELIDKMLPWVVDYPGPVAGSPQRDALLAEIEERRKGHG